MTLVYRSCFTDPDGRISGSVERLFVEWLGQKGLRVPDSGLAQGGGPLDSVEGQIAWGERSRLRPPGGRPFDRLRLVEESDEGRWVTTVVWGDEPAARSDGASRRWIWVDLEHEPVGDRPVLRPGSPRLVRELLAAGEAQDGDLPVTSEAWRVNAAQAPELARYISSAQRNVPVIVFASDAKRAYDQDRLARSLARDLAGVAAVFQLADGAATERLAELLPAGYAVYGGAMRTFLPAATAVGDSATRHRVLGRASLAALGGRAFPAVKDQILEVSTRRSAPFALRARVPARTPAGSSAPDARGFGRGWVASRLRRLLGAIGREPEPVVEDLDDEKLSGLFDTAVDALIRRGTTPVPTVPPTTADLARLATLEQQVRDLNASTQLLEQLFEESQRELRESSDRATLLAAEVDDLQVELAETAEDADRATRRMRWLERESRSLNLAGKEVADELPQAPPSVAEALELARRYLRAVEIGPTDQVAAELDLSGNAQLYAIKTWSALVALNAYAEARGRGDFASGFYEWCLQPPAGAPGISAGAVAMTESESVDKNPKLRDVRCFPVSTEAEPSGRAYMPAHVKIVKRGAPCPRLHFLDRAATTGKVYVGYVGAHLPTANFS